MVFVYFEVKNRKCPVYAHINLVCAQCMCMAVFQVNLCELYHLEWERCERGKFVVLLPYHHIIRFVRFSGAMHSGMAVDPSK